MLYIGKYSINRSVNRGKFFPHDNNNEMITQDNNQNFVGPLAVKSDKIKRKNTEIPIYAGASNIGWSPQYVGTAFVKFEA